MINMKKCIRTFWTQYARTIKLKKGNNKRSLMPEVGKYDSLEV